MAKAATWQPHAALLDIGLPGMDGYEVAQRLRRLPFGDDLLIVAISGYAAAADVSRALASGFDVHLAKPPDLQTLFDVIEEFRRNTRRI